MARQEGYYWVKYEGVFEIAKWTTFGWLLTGGTPYFEDSDFEHINENRIKEPGELPEF